MAPPPAHAGEKRPSVRHNRDLVALFTPFALAKAPRRPASRGAAGSAYDTAAEGGRMALVHKREVVRGVYAHIAFVAVLPSLERGLDRADEGAR